MKISEVSKKLNIPGATLRYYEQIGLLDKISKKDGIRDYNEKDIERIKFIKCMKQAGFPLDSIVTFLKLNEDKKEGEEKRLEMLLTQKEELIKEMKRQEETLEFLNYKINMYQEKVNRKKKKNDK